MKVRTLSVIDDVFFLNIIVVTADLLVFNVFVNLLLSAL